jgi:hypothetical protein
MEHLASFPTIEISRFRDTLHPLLRYCTSMHGQEDKDGNWQKMAGLAELPGNENKAESAPTQS